MCRLRCRLVTASPPGNHDGPPLKKLRKTNIRPTVTMPVFLGPVLRFLEQYAPPELAESWDNTGLLVGDRESEIARVMTCLTLTPDVAEEAIRRQADLIVSHHPVLFRPVQRITSETVEGRLLLDLIRAGAAVYSPHTSFDGAPQGINQRLAERLGLQDIVPLRSLPCESTTSPCGSGRMGTLSEAEPLARFLARVHERLKVSRLDYTGEPAQSISRVAVGCGSAAEFLRDAAAAGCHLLLTGEARFHAFLDARSQGMALVAIGHYASERPAVEDLADVVKTAFPSLEVWASQTERDPIRCSPET